MVKSEFTGQGGKKRQCNKLGWSNKGIEFYKKVHECWRELSGESEYNTWTMLHDTWATYKEEKPTLVIQAEGRRISTKKQKRTSMKEEKVVHHKFGAQNFVCWMEKKISWMTNQPQRE